MTIVFKAFDGTEFPNSKECIEYENSRKPYYQMWCNAGETDDTDLAFVLYIRTLEGAKFFIEDCINSDADYSGIEEDSIGWFIWDGCHYIKISESAAKTLEAFFFPEKSV